MKTIAKKKFISIPFAAALLLLSAYSYFPHTHAQTAAPQLYLTWKASTYTPQTFTGKVLPGANSQITASVELIDNGKPVDLVNQTSTVYWYLNGNFLQGGKALQQITLRAPDTAGGTLDLRAEISVSTPGKKIDALKTVTIPIAQPETIIEAPFPSGVFSSPIMELIGVPYFFDVKDLSRLNFSWSVNGQSPTGAENPRALTIRAGSGAAAGSEIEVALTIKNPDALLELGSKIINLTYQP